MKCEHCNFYKKFSMYNECELTGADCLKPLENCKLVAENGKVNKTELDKVFCNVRA